MRVFSTRSNPLTQLTVDDMQGEDVFLNVVLVEMTAVRDRNWLVVQSGRFQSKLKGARAGKEDCILESVGAANCVRMDLRVDGEGGFVFCRLVDLKQCVEALRGIEFDRLPEIEMSPHDLSMNLDSLLDSNVMVK